MKKVGILTLHESSNFGACLQAVATYKILKEFGIECEFINYTCKEIAHREILLGEKSEHSLFYRIRVKIKYSDIVKKQKEISKFLLSEAIVGEQRYNRKNIKFANERYEMFLVGSDMLWCTKFTNSDYTYMLDFVEDNAKKMSYATSVGFYWENEEENQILEYLKKFSIISVRECDMACRLRQKISNRVYETCDPTMLIKPDIWKQYISLFNSNKHQYSLVYVDVPSRKGLKSAYEYSKINGCQTYLMEYKKSCKDIPHRLLKVYSIEAFLSSIYHAEIVFTSSYHGMLFAIYFHIPFVYYNKDLSRLECVAQKLNLTTRNGDKYDFREMQPINWDEVDMLREKFRIESLKVINMLERQWNAGEKL